jgi:hypothetical protein
MDKINYKESLDNLTTVMESATSSMKIAAKAINDSMTPELKDSMTPTQRKMIAMSKSLMNFNINNPEELFEKQQELTAMMTVAQKEADEMAKKEALNKTQEHGN